MKKAIYKEYEAFKALRNNDFTKEQIMEDIKTKLEIEDTAELEKNVAVLMEKDRKHDPKQNGCKFGVELEFAGWPTKEFGNSLIEWWGSDGSVNDEGTELNLKPIEYNGIMGDFRKNLEILMAKGHDVNFEVDWSAGMHIHLSGETSTPDNGSKISRIWTALSEGVRFPASGEVWYAYEDGEETQNMREDDYNDDDDDWGCDDDEDDHTYYVENRNVFRDNETEIRTTKAGMLLECMKFLYSTSNRSGFEPYGLGWDFTRGYTSHDTIELRCWRTTLDFRSVSARVKVAAFWLNYVLKAHELVDEGFANWEDFNIWDEINKMHNNETRNAYIYLAFHPANKHSVGKTEEKLMELLKMDNTAGKAQIQCIKERASFIENAFEGNRKKAKDLFKNV